jgi:RTX calcium-binding nonapeptide repeat (4 copies)
MRRFPAVAATIVALSGFSAPGALAMASHAGWPQITGMLLMNKRDTARPLDGRPGQDPFDGTDRTYSCDQVHHSTHCFHAHPSLGFVSARDPHGRHTFDSGPLTDNLVPSDVGHNELLGGHGNNTIHAGPAGDVIWGDYHPSGDPPTQFDHLFGGPGNDFIYGGHGTNTIWTGGGVDVVHVHFGRGTIHCQSANVTVFLSHKSRPRYVLDGDCHVSYRLDPGSPPRRYRR